MAGGAFLFGKLPAHGDFVARGLSDADRDTWDAWSTSALDALRSMAGDNFEDAHAQAQPWRFVIGEGTRWKAGAWAPSVDSAGRRYLFAVGWDALTAEEAGASGLGLAAEAESQIYNALAHSFTADEVLEYASSGFHDVLEPAAAAALAAAPQSPGVWWTLGLLDTAVTAGAPPSDLFARTVAPLLEPAV